MMSKSVDFGTIVLEIIKCGANLDLVSEFFMIFSENLQTQISPNNPSHELPVFNSTQPHLARPMLWSLGVVVCPASATALWDPPLV